MLPDSDYIQNPLQIKGTVHKGLQSCLREIFRDPKYQKSREKQKEFYVQITFLRLTVFWVLLLTTMRGSANNFTLRLQSRAFKNLHNHKSLFFSPRAAFVILRRA
jgi:hypothetical protein